MKKLIILILFCQAIISFSQIPIKDAPVVKTDYLKKSKHLQRAATIVLISGPVLVLAPLLILAGEKTGGNATAGIVYSSIMAGFLCLPVSISLFIAASSTKKKAIQLSLKNETAPLISKRRFEYNSAPSFNIKFNL